MRCLSRRNTCIGDYSLEEVLIQKIIQKKKEKEKLLPRHYTGVYLGRDYGTHDRRNYQGEVIGINVKPAGKFWEVVHGLAEALRRAEGMDAEVVKSVAKHGVDDLEDPHDRDDDGHHTCAARDGIGADRR